MFCNEKIVFALPIFFVGNGSVPPTILLMLINEHLVKDEIALNFLLEVCSTLKQEKGLQSLVQALKKGNIESRYVTCFVNTHRGYPIIIKPAILNALISKWCACDGNSIF